jgi:hypothetical protein
LLISHLGKAAVQIRQLEQSLAGLTEAKAALDKRLVEAEQDRQGTERFAITICSSVQQDHAAYYGKGEGCGLDARESRGNVQSKS